LVSHQLIATYGISFTAPIVFALGFKVLFVLGQNYSRRDFYSVVFRKANTFLSKSLRISSWMAAWEVLAAPVDAVGLDIPVP